MSEYTVTCPAVSLTVSFVEAGVLKLRYVAPGQLPRQRSFAVLPRQGPAPEVRQGQRCGALVACSAELAVEVDEACRVRVTRADGTLVLEDGPEGGFFRGTENGRAVHGVQRATPPGEAFYGFGEHTGPLERRGRTMAFYNTDAYDAPSGGFRLDADPLYLSIPFFLGLREGLAYGVFTDNSSRLGMDMAQGAAQRYRVWAREGVLDQYVLAGPSMGEVLQRYARLTGAMALPPRWALGYHQSRWGYSPDARVKEIASELRRRQLPSDGLWLDIQHMRGFRSFTWDPATFPDPAGLLRDLAAQGFKTTVIVDPGLKQDPAWDVYAQGLADGHFLKDPSGAVYIGKVWPGEAAFPDFSAPRTRAWWGGLVSRAVSVGVRGIWTDMNEPSNFVDGTVPDALVGDGDGEKATFATLHNVYALHEAQATYEGMLAAAPDRRPFVLTRAGFAGSQRYAAAWTGDAVSSWQTLAQTPAMLMNLGLSGMPFVGSDVGGYSGGCTPELFARWIQLGSISPFFRGHVTENVKDQEPWAFGQEVEDLSREAISERYRLLPYLYSLFALAHQTGAPILRPLVYEFGADAAALRVDDQLLLGPWLLYAPVLQQGATRRKLYLPAGRWFERGSGAVYEGPATIEVGVTLAALPTFVREGAILPVAPLAQHTGAQPRDVLGLDVYPGAGPSAFTLYEDDGETPEHLAGRFARTRYALQATAGGATLTAAAPEGSYPRPARRLTVRVLRVDHEPTQVMLSGQLVAKRASAAELAAGAPGWHWDANALALRVAFDEPAGFTLELAYDRSLVALAPKVRRSFRVKLPPGTPAGEISIASNANGWQHQPLGTRVGDVVEGTLEVPRGEWFLYKFTRGGWPSVEKWPGCVEATNRYAFGAAEPVKEDQVFQWADRCP